jgi:predicted RNA-binding protein with PUA-like domain
MNYWIVKSEPFKYSWDRLIKDGQTFWDGVRNYAARNNLRAMKNGDKVFFYHSNEGLEIVGLAQVVREAYPDPTIDDDTWVAVDIKPVKTLKKPVPLAVMKKTPGLESLQLIRIGRLSVSAVTEEEYQVIMSLAGERSTKPKKY